MARRVLMVCYHFPPAGGIASLRALRFVRYLPEYGWEPVVLTPNRTRYLKDPALGEWAGWAVRTPALELQRTGQRVSGGTAAPGSLLSGLRQSARDCLYFPDGQVGWYPFALASGRRLLREARFDAIFSSAYPITAHVVAWRLSQESGVPWVAEFRDLWTDWSPARGWRRRREVRLELALLRAVSAVVGTSKTHAVVLAKRAAKPGTAITNGFDPHVSGGDEAPAAHGQPVTIVHLGTYYPAVQEIETALAGLSQLRASGSLPAVRLRFIGTDLEPLRGILGKHGLTDVVEETGFVPHAEAGRLLRQSDLALLGGPRSAEDATNRGWIPAKTFEYLGSGLPVLLVGDPKAEVAGIVGELRRSRVVASGDVTSAAEGLAALLRLARQPPEDAVLRFSSRALGGDLARVLDGAVRKRPTA